MITSTSNPQIKNLVLLGKKARARKEQGVFLAEGAKMFREAPESWIQRIYVTEEYLSDENRRAEMEGFSYETVSAHVMKAAGDTQTPQGILLLLSMPEWDFAEISRRENGCFLFLENIQDPGNLGTMLRTAEAAGMTAVIADGAAADLYNPKTVRATMGSIYRMPFFVAEDFHGTIRQMKGNGMKLYAAHLQGSRMYDAFSYRESCGFLIGNEGNGLLQETAGLADAWIRIPMAGEAESLNAAVAAAVLMYEANRQRRR